MKRSEITVKKLSQLDQSLLFLHVAELKQIAIDLELKPSKKKIHIISQIMLFPSTGKKSTTAPFPIVSLGKPIKNMPVKAETKMLKGQYKNDLKTRIFFKTLIGPYFHFTASGIDWLNDRWMKGTPPTYQEFANMWQEAYEQQKIDPLAPKMEWAYIRFVQAYNEQCSHATQSEIIKAWNLEREKHLAIVNTILK